MSGQRKAILGIAAAPLVLIALLSAAWALDSWIASDRVARNVVVAGIPVGGQDRDELTDTVESAAAEFPATEVVVDVDEFRLDTVAADLGLGLDVDATVDAAFEVGRDDPLPTRPVRWLRAWFSERDVAAHLDVDPEPLTFSLAVLEGDRRSAPVDPVLEATEEAVSVVPGVPGRAITVNDVVAALPTRLASLEGPLEISVEQTTTDPDISDEQVQALADRANEATDGPMTLVTGSGEVEVDGSRLRPAFTMVTQDGSEPQLSMDLDPVAAVLDDSVSTPPNPTGVRFDFPGGVPTPVGGQDAQVCCGEDAPQRVVDALLAGERTAELPGTTVTAAQGREWAAGLGVREVVGSFTTNHACCQDRVTNIQTMAARLQGELIPPGTTFSVNDTVGRRTVEKGYLEGGVIQDGEFTTDVGGGVSQFATTLFNAAFFAGFDIPTYKMHSKYISRYPFAREATLSYDSVDLEIRNDTDYGIVIWPTWTDTSITVDLWSTRTAVGEQTAQSKASGCGSVTTERTRTFTDGRVETDTFRANYDCD